MAGPKPRYALEHTSARCAVKAGFRGPDPMRCGSGPTPSPERPTPGEFPVLWAGHGRRTLSTS